MRIVLVFNGCVMAMECIHADFVSRIWKLIRNRHTALLEIQSATFVSLSYGM